MSDIGDIGVRTRRQIPPRAVLVGGSIVLTIVVLATFGSVISPYDPTAFAIQDRFSPPSISHWFGTDEFGRDVLSRVLVGAKYSLAMGFGATAISVALGVPLGLIAAFYSGWLETAIMRTADLLMGLPPILFGLVVLAVTPSALWKTIVVVGIIYIPILARLTRSVALSLLQENFVLAARARGERAGSILVHEILPNTWPPIIVECSLRATFAVLLGSSLSFLGLGAQPPSSEWGLMIAESRQFVDQAPWISIAPGLSLCILLVAVNTFGEGLRKWLDPRLIGGMHD